MIKKRWCPFMLKWHSIFGAPFSVVSTEALKVTINKAHELAHTAIYVSTD
jgi:hypothetical protein